MNSQLLITENVDEDVDALDYAEDYLKAGLNVIPVANRGKLAAVKWKEHQSNMSTISQCQDWFFSCDYNVGIVTGDVSGVVVLDIDS